MSVLDSITGIFGSTTKWILIGATGFGAVIILALTITLAAYMKYILIGVGGVGALAIIGFIIYKIIQSKKS